MQSRQAYVRSGCKMLPLSLSWIPILKKSSGKLQLKSHRMLLLLDSSTQTEHSERLPVIHITLMLRNCKVAASGLIDFYVWSGRQCLCPKLFSNLSNSEASKIVGNLVANKEVLKRMGSKGRWPFSCHTKSW